MLSQQEPALFKDKDRLLNRRKLLANSSGRRPIAKQRWEPIKLITEGPPHENVASTTHDTAKLARAGLSVLNVMPDVGQPHEIKTLAPQWNALCSAGNICKIALLVPTGSDVKHLGRRLYGNDLNVKRSCKQRREAARACAKIQDPNKLCMLDKRRENGGPFPGSVVRKGAACLITGRNSTLVVDHAGRKLFHCGMCYL